MSETQVQHISRVEEITRILRDEILSRQYRPGERLPSERDLAVRFKVNRGAIRESLKKLEQLGIASITPGGVRVVPVEEASLSVLRPLIEIQDIPDPVLIGNLLEVWGTLMSMTAKIAVSRATSQQISEMRKLVNRIIKNSFAEDGNHLIWYQLSTCFTRINNNLVLRLIMNGLMTQFLDHPSKPDKINLVVNPRQRSVLLRRLEQSIARQDSEATAIAISDYFILIKESVTTAISHANNSRLPLDQQQTGVASYE